MKSKLTYFVLILMLAAASNSFAAYYVYIEDGLEHIDYTDYGRTETIRVDYNIDNVPGTQVTFKGSGTTSSNLGIYVYNHGNVVIDTLKNYNLLYVTDYGTATVNDGELRAITSAGNSFVSVNGGTFAYASSRITAGGNGFCELNGVFDITYGGYTEYGVTSGNLRDLFNLGTGSLDNTNFAISGTLANGDIWTDVYMRIYQYGNIAIVPIPGAVWLLGSGLLGMVGLKRRRIR